MNVIEKNHYAYPESAAVSRTLLGSHETPVVEQVQATPENSILIWPTERVVQPTDFAQVTLWKAPVGAVLPISSEKQNTISSRQQLPTLDRFAERSKKPQGLTGVNRTVVRYILLAIMIISFVVMASVVIPDVYYRLQPEEDSEVLSRPTTTDSQLADLLPTPTPMPILPPVDPSLPEGDWLRIPGIGVDAGVLATANADEALTQGAWMVPDFGRPADSTQPTIIASHRYGWLNWWQTDFGRKNSFYYLPEVGVGDRIEVITDQRKYVYTVYAVEEGQLISDYEGDLILYTCKFLNSPERYFVYARRELVG